MIEACYCNWDIPGVDKLPAHSHMDRALVRHKGRDFWAPLDALELNPRLIVIDSVEGINIWVDWKAVARALGEGTRVS